MVTDITGSPAARVVQMRRLLLAGGFALAALLIVAGFITIGGDTSSRRVVEGDAVAASAAIAAPAGDQSRSVQPFAVYLVDSAEDAVELERRMAILTPDGLARDAGVLVAGTNEDDVQASIALRDLKRQHSVDGVRVFDLRRPDVARTAAAPPPCDATPSAPVAIGAC